MFARISLALIAFVVAGAEPAVGYLGCSNYCECAMEPSRNLVAFVQDRLKQQDLYKKAADGILGPETKSAILAYRRKNHLPETSAIDIPFLQALLGSDYREVAALGDRLALCGPRGRSSSAR